MLFRSGLERLEAQAQVTPGTSLLAQEVGEATNTSPVLIDNVIRGYTGTLGTYFVMALDAVMRGEGDPTKATLRMEQMPVIKRFFASPDASGNVTAYYELKQRVNQAVATINFYERTGDYEKMIEFMEERKGAQLLAIKPLIQALDKNMQELRETRSAILLSSMDPDEKRDALTTIQKAQVALTRNMQEVKKMID